MLQIGEQPENLQHTGEEAAFAPAQHDHTSARTAWRRIVLQATALWLVTRLTLVAFTAFAVPFEAKLHAPPESSVTFSAAELAGRWLQWDAHWYISIAQHGYTSAQATAFFPLYPLLIHGVTLLIGPHVLFASLLVANLGTWGGFVGVGLLAAHESGKERSAFSAVRVMAAYPLAFFLAAPYTDGLFLAGVACSLLAARQGKWRLATLCGCLALATRLTGLILILPLLWEYGRQHGWWQRATWRDGAWWRMLPSRAVGGAVLMLAGLLIGLALYMLFLWVKFGDPLLFLHAEELFWHHTGILNLAVQTGAQATATTPIHHHAAHTATWGYEQARSLVDLAAVAFFAILTIIGARRLPFAYTLYMIGLLALVVSSPRPDHLGFFVSAGRYLTAAIPIFMLIGRWTERHAWLDMLVVSGGFLLQAACALFFLSGGWMV
jgi:hypothetical protein